MRDKKKVDGGIDKMPRAMGFFGLFTPFLIMVLMALYVASCTKDENQANTETDAMNVAGINDIIPANLSDSVEVNPVVSVTFKSGTDPAVISASTITLKKGSTLIPGQTTISGTTASFVPSTDLSADAKYTATVKTGHTGGSAESGSHEYSWSFQTGSHHHGSTLSVVSVDPLNQATGVPVTASLTVTFNKELTTAMKTSSLVTLSNGTTAVDGLLSYTGSTATFKPSSSLAPNTLYKGRVKMGSGSHEDDRDKSGDSFGWSFTTAAASGNDVTAPKVSSVVPANNATSVVTGSAYKVTFSESMNPATITSSTITVKQGTVVVAGTVSYSGVTATFTPSAALTANTLYTCSITTGVKDVAGNALAAGYSSSFTTASATDVTAPTVLSVLPAGNAASVPTTSSLTATFSEAMTATSITSTTFTLKQGSASVAGAVSYSGTTATFKPASALSAGTTYTGTITTGVKDATGNGLAANYSWTFTTSAQADVTAPMVASVLPAVSATGVAVSSKATVTFSEAMTATTITSTTFTLKQGATNVAGTVSYTGTTATFTPSVALAGSTSYTGTITTGAKDAAGNALAANYTWTFTTAAPADVTAPKVSSVTPAVNAATVAVNSKPTVTFSEAMTASTITTTTFTLKQGSTSVAGTVSYSGTTATFTPSAALAGNTVYTGTITTGAKDAAGNSIAASYTWNFTTVATVTGLSFAKDVLPVLNVCNTCHTHPWTPSAVASTFYTNLVSGGYVNPSSPTTSKIYVKLSGGHPGSVVTTAQVNNILTWMTQGSLNN